MDLVVIHITFQFKKLNRKKLGIAFEILDNDNDFYYEAFDSSKDFRRYWKDFNFYTKFEKNLKILIFHRNCIYTRSLNYQWQLDDYAQPYYHPGRDVNNFHQF